MTTQKCVDIFNVLQDKYGSPDVQSGEVVDFLNMATYEWLNRLVPSNLGGVVNYEFDQNTLTNIKPLVYPVTIVMSAGGIITNTAFTSALVTAGAEAGATWYRIGNIGITIGSETYPVKFTKHNNLWAYQRNFFKKTSATKFRYTVRQDGLRFYPIDTTNPMSLTVIKNPKALSLVGPINPELDDAQMFNIIIIALKLAGISTRDEEVLEDVRLASLQTAQ